jgi:hypothetical protein
MALADGGELLVLAPGIDRFGEDEASDRLIRKYGYRGRLRTLELLKENEDLRMNMAAAAHLIHGSSDGRFTVTYAVKAMGKSEIESVGFKAADCGEALRRYDPASSGAAGTKRSRARKYILYPIPPWPLDRKGRL